MATTKVDNNRIAWTYTTNDAEAFRTSAKYVYVGTGDDAAKFGGSAAAASMRALPASFRTRKALVVDAAGATRAVVVYETDAALWTTPGTTVTLNKNGVDTVFTSSGDLKPERYGRSTKQQS
jgi:hypothetical protein